MKIRSTKIPETPVTFEFFESGLFKKNGYRLAYLRFRYRIILVMKGFK